MTLEENSRNLVFLESVFVYNLTMKSWFVQIGDKIQGPMDAAAVEQLILKNKDCLVWGKGMNEWMAYSDWRKTIDNAVEKESRVSLWQFRFNDQESKIFKLDELIFELRQLPGYDNVYVKSDQDPKWQLLFTVAAITERLGITRRAQLRVPIFGFFEGQNISTGATFTCKLLTLSEGGFGLTDAFGLAIGHSIKGQIISPNLNQPLAIIGDVVYSGIYGDLGIKFSSLSRESQSLVIDYISKFKETEI